MSTVISALEALSGKCEAESMAWEFPYWMSGFYRTGEKYTDIDESEDLCSACAAKKKAQLELEHAAADEVEIGYAGGYAGSSVSTPSYCDECGEPLYYYPTDDCAEDTIACLEDYLQQAGNFEGLSPRDAFEIMVAIERLEENGLPEKLAMASAAKLKIAEFIAIGAANSPPRQKIRI